PRQVLHAVFAEIDGDAINPRAEPRISAERADRLEHLHEHLLRHVLGFVETAEHAKEQPKDALLVGLHERVERALVVGNQALDEARFRRIVELLPLYPLLATKVARAPRHVAARSRRGPDARGLEAGEQPKCHPEATAKAPPEFPGHAPRPP